MCNAQDSTRFSYIRAHFLRWCSVPPQRIFPPVPESKYEGWVQVERIFQIPTVWSNMVTQIPKWYLLISFGYELVAIPRGNASIVCGVSYHVRDLPSVIICDDVAKDPSDRLSPLTSAKSYFSESRYSARYVPANIPWPMTEIHIIQVGQKGLALLRKCVPFKKSRTTLLSLVLSSFFFGTQKCVPGCTSLLFLAYEFLRRG